MLLRLAFAFFSLAASVLTVSAAETRPHVSQCQLIAEGLPAARFVAFSPGSDRLKVGGPQIGAERAALAEDVIIRFLGHSTFEIETPTGITIATDYNGWLRSVRLPDVVTMNKAHSSHYTLSPDPVITNVLHGWSDVPGQPAKHRLLISDAYIRNVSTDIRSYGGFEENGNSIFIFEIAGLCIGHLGHLHHELTDSHYAEIGRLDVVMVPVDGGLTMGADSMSRVITRLRSALILPMHRRGPPIDTFLAMFGPEFDWSISDHSSVTVSMRTLPKKPLILVLKGV
ncbi:MAG: MBL fold metallo-hydrolase [Allorhizobium sp.]